MTQLIYVRNLPANTSADEVRSLFAAHGPVQSARLITSSQSGRTRTYGVVQMNSAEAQSAVAAINGTFYRGRRLQVNHTGGRQRSRSGGQSGGTQR